MSPEILRSDGKQFEKANKLIKTLLPIEGASILKIKRTKKLNESHVSICKTEPPDMHIVLVGHSQLLLSEI